MKFCTAFVAAATVLLARNSVFVQSKDHIGSSCTLSNGNAGVCKRLTECAEVLLNIQYEQPTFCSEGSMDGSPLVCCPKPKVSVTQRIDTIYKKAPVYDPPEYVKKTKSYKKCLEWSESAYVWRKYSLVPNDPPEKVSQCGFEVKPLIVGGEPAEIKEFPHMVLLGYGNEGNYTWECGGSLISEQFVLTARHCLYSPKTKGPPVVVHAGFVKFNQRNEFGSLQQFHIVDKITPPDSKANQYNDIALLKLDKPASFTAYVRPACLHVEKEFQFKSALATGWGTDTAGVDKKTEELMKVRLTFVNHQACYKTYEQMISRKLKEGIVDASQFCAGDFQKDTCQGDSGGPLQTYRTDIHCMYDIVGITSIGAHCGLREGVYTRVSHFVPWIERTVWPDSSS